MTTCDEPKPYLEWQLEERLRGSEADGEVGLIMSVHELKKMLATLKAQRTLLERYNAVVAMAQYVLQVKYREPGAELPLDRLERELDINTPTWRETLPH